MSSQKTDAPGKDQSQGNKSERPISLLFLIMFIVGTLGYFTSTRGTWVFYVFSHLGALGVMGLLGAAAGALAKRKGYRYRTAFALGFYLPIVSGLLAVALIYLLSENGSIYCGGSVSFLIATPIVLFYSFAKKKINLQAVQGR